jgi:cyclopropane fatty-acyl-phospholipid synthase-like methyltransferase
VLTYEYAFDPQQPNNTAASIYAVARAGGPRLLDVGSGPAVVSSMLANVDGFEVTCVDADAAALEMAASRGVAETVVADLEAADWWAPLAGRTWDTVILADVLEHLRDPARILQALREQKLLAEDGSLVVSIPNATHQAVLAELLSGDFRYQRVGILDETHIRWFTLESMTRLLESNGFLVHEVRRTLRTLEQSPHGHRTASLSPAAKEAIDELGIEGRTYQYILRARPTSESLRLAALHDEVQQERVRAEEARREADLLQRRLDYTEKLFRAERDRARAELSAGAKELTNAEAKLEKAERRAARLQADLDARTAQLKTRQQSQDSPEQIARASARLGRRALRKAARAARNPDAVMRRLRSRRSR